MLKLISVSLLSLMLSACASTPAFKKSSNGAEGYTVHDLEAKNHFRVTVNMPEWMDEKYLLDYGYRAVGEECAARGLQYFDVGELEPKTFEGFCFSDSTRKALAITFQTEALKDSPRRFVVESLNGKTNSKVQADDEVLLINGKPPISMANVKSLVLAASLTKKSALPLKIKRKGKELEIVEPVVDLADGAMDQSQLDVLRRTVR